MTSHSSKQPSAHVTEELLPSLQRALADDTVSIIACPVDSSENISLTDKLRKLTESI